jgi:tRNA(fMet)-specific endonuclease VapC
MIYLLDTNAWIEYLNGRSPAIAGRIATTRLSDLRLCSVVVAELAFGAHKGSRTADNLRVLQQIQSYLISLPFDDSAAAIYGQVRVQLERAGTPIGPNDLMIASIAVANDLTLVTRNLREFSRVSSLKLENWSAGP